MTEFIHPFVIIVSFVTHARTQFTKSKSAQTVLIQRTYFRKAALSLKVYLSTLL